MVQDVLLSQAQQILLSSFLSTSVRLVVTTLIVSGSGRRILRIGGGSRGIDAVARYRVVIGSRGESSGGGRCGGGLLLRHPAARVVVVEGGVA